MNIEKLLDEEIQSEFECLKDMEMGSDAYKTGVEGLSKLMDRSIELKKIEMECSDSRENKELENAMKEQQFEAEQKDRKTRNLITIAGIVVPTMVTIWGTLKTFKFEETGTVTSPLGRGFINKILPKK